MAAEQSGPRPAADETVQQFRKETDGGEPIYSDTRQVIDNNQALYVNLTKVGKDRLDIEKGDEVVVKTFDGRLVVEPAP